MEKREEERKKEKSDDPFKWWNDNVKKNILYFQPYLHTHYIFFIFLVVKPAIAASATFLPSEIGKKFEFYQSNKKTNANELKNKKKITNKQNKKNKNPIFHWKIQWTSQIFDFFWYAAFRFYWNLSKVNSHFSSSQSKFKSMLFYPPEWKWYNWF